MSRLPTRRSQDMPTLDCASADPAGWMAVRPLAASEQPGPHQPVYPDTCIAEGITARTIELRSLAVYLKALSAYHFAVADILEWKGIQIEDLPEFKPPPPDSLTPRALPPSPPPAAQ